MVDEFRLSQEEPGASMAQDRLNAILTETLENERIEENREAEERVNVVVRRILNHLTANRTPFRRAKRLNIGSYYEKLEVSCKVVSSTNFNVINCVLQVIFVYRCLGLMHLT